MDLDCPSGDRYLDIPCAQFYEVLNACGTVEDWIEGGFSLHCGLVEMTHPAALTQIDANSICRQTKLFCFQSRYEHVGVERAR